MNYEPSSGRDGVSVPGKIMRRGLRTVMQHMPDPSAYMRVIEDDGVPRQPDDAIFRRRRYRSVTMELLRPADHLRTRQVYYARCLAGRDVPAPNGAGDVPSTHGAPPPESPRTLYHLHGGGYWSGIHEIYRLIAYRYLKHSGADLVATVDYRHLPDHPFPAALEDARTGWEYLLRQGSEPSRTLFVGDSAGANLALALLLWLRDHGEPLPAGVVLLSPWADLTFSGISIYTNRHRDPIFGVPETEEPDPADYHRFMEYAGDHDPTDPYISPVFGHYEGLPPMFIQSGGDEMLLSDGLRVETNARAAGVPVMHTIFPGMYHTFQIIGGPLIPEGRQARKEEMAAIRRFWETGYLLDPSDVSRPGSSDALRPGSPDVSSAES